MDLYQGIENFPQLASAIVTSGTFDGVHLGHQKILTQLHDTARQQNGQSVVVTFYPHPRQVLGQSVEMLSTLQEKAELLAHYQVDHLLIIPFTTEFSQLSAEEFIQKIYIDTLHTKELIIGYDHRFGKNRSGDFGYLQKNISRYPFGVKEISQEDIDQVGISSTKIRNSLKQGDIRTANLYLGRAYSFQGKVVTGDKLGRTIGYPTANLIINKEKLLPGDGIYAVRVDYESQLFEGMLYIGNRPTLEGATEKRVEVNIFDFKQEIYGKILTVYLIDFIRPDAKLSNIEALQNQLYQDELASKAALAQIYPPIITKAPQSIGSGWFSFT